MAQKCPKCKNTDVDYINKKRWLLKIIYNPKDDRILLLGDKAGLEFLSNCCLSVIGKHDPSGHIHLEWQNNNLVEGSTETILEFSNDPDNYK